jgi:hypothetical protein
MKFTAVNEDILLKNLFAWLNKLVKNGVFNDDKEVSDIGIQRF